MENFDVSDELLSGDIRVLRIAGDVDFDGAPQLKRQIVSRFDAGERQLIIDLSEVRFIDSTAIGVLVGAIKRLRANRGSLAVVCDDADVRGIFEAVGLENVIPLYRTQDEAFAALASAV